MKNMARTLSIVVAVLLAVGGSALAVITIGPDGFRQPPVHEAPPSWGAIIYSILFVMVVCPVAFKNSKRSHLD